VLFTGAKYYFYGVAVAILRFPLYLDYDKKLVCAVCKAK
jgi:hypothetical protein